ncbi:MFS transporter [Microbacterium sp. BWT-B31]|uniref:MFS transporter n=1 Tax=Microbacterium sp. BWT-B31 TaxID=3232072 RepID=UPI003527F435
MEAGRTRWLPIGLLVAVGIAAAMQFAKVSTIFVEVTEAFGAPEPIAALFISAPAIVGMLLGLTASVAAARIGFRRVILACLAIGGLLSLAESFLPPVPVFLALRLLEGVAHLGLVVSCPVLIILLSTRRHVSLAMSLWGAFFGLAFAITGWAAPAVEARWGVAGVFLGHALVFAVLLIAVVLLLPRVAGDGPQAQVRGDGFFRAHALAYRSPRAFLPGVVFVFHTMMYVPLVAFVPLFADPAIAGVLLVWMPLVSIVGTIVAGFVGQYTVTPPVVLIAGYAGVAVLVLGVWAAVAAEGALLVAPLALMFFSGLVQGAAFGLIPALSTDPVVTSRANGVLTQLGNLGSTIGPPVFASLIAGVGVTAFAPMAWLVVALCAAGGAVSVIALRMTGARPRSGLAVPHDAP